MKLQIFKRTVFDSLMNAYFIMLAMVLMFRPDETELLNLSRNFGIFCLALIFGAIASFSLNHFKVKTTGELLFEPAHKKATAIGYPWYQTFYGWQLGVFIVSTLAVGFVVTEFSIYKLLDRQYISAAMRLFEGILTPNFDLLPRAILKMIETIFLAFMATFLAIPIAFILSFFCAKNMMRSPFAFFIYMSLRTLLNAARSIEAFIWAIIFSVWVGIGPFAGMLALWIHSIVSLAKQYSEIVETVNEGPIEGVLSTGANKIQMIWFAVVPQVILPFISFTIYRWDINIRMATIVGFVGGGGIGSLLQAYQGRAEWNEVGTILLVIAFVVWFMDTASAYIREALK